jgi:hypothetical protein
VHGVHACFVRACVFEEANQSGLVVFVQGSLVFSNDRVSASPQEMRGSYMQLEAAPSRHSRQARHVPEGTGIARLRLHPASKVKNK